MAQPPSTPVKVPPSAANYTAATQDADLRSQLNMLMLREGHITKIQDRLLHGLDAHSSNWTMAVQAHALSLLRSGEISTFPALIRRVLDDVRHETATTTSAKNGDDSLPNGTPVTNGSNKKGVNGTTAPASSAEGSLAVPPAVVEAALKVARESLEEVCEVDDSGKTR